MSALFWPSLAVATGLIYAGSCAWWPFARCGRCKGTGRFSRKDGKVFRDCRRCKGSGRRLRIGRRIYNHVHAVRKKAT